MKTRINTSNAPAAIGPYSQAIDSGAGIVFVSGQLPIDPATGAFPEGGVKEQTRQSLTNAKAILEAAGLSLLVRYPGGRAAGIDACGFRLQGRNGENQQIVSETARRGCNHDAEDEEKQPHDQDAAVSL